MLVNASITLYNYYRNNETSQEEWHIKHLNPVHFEPRKADNIINSGLSTADSLLLYVWFSVDAEGKTYLQPKEYAALDPVDVVDYWTMTPMKDRIVKGNVSDIMQDAVSKYDEVFTIQNVDTKDFGSQHMRHWEISAK